MTTEQHDEQQITPLAIELSTLDGLSDERRQLYVPDANGKGFRLNVASDPRKLLNALRNERTRADDAERAAGERDTAVKAAEAERDAAKAQAEAARGQILEVLTRAQCATAGLHPQAIDDAVRASRDLFRVDEAGKIVARDGAGLELPQWLAASRTSSPHWWPASSGSGAVQTSAPATQARTINRRSFDSRTPAQRAALLHAGVTVTDY